MIYKIIIVWLFSIVVAPSHTIIAMQKQASGFAAWLGHTWHNEKDPWRAMFDKASVHECIDAGDMVALQDRLDNGADINLMSYCGSEFICTPLQYAIYLDKFDIAFELIRRGADVNKYYAKYLLTSLPPLLLAMKKISDCSVPLIHKLVEHGAKLNTPRVKLSGTVLTFALHFAPADELEKDYFYDLVEYFIQKNLNIFIKDSVGMTALHWAVHKDNLRLVDLLCQHGADINEKDADGKGLTHYVRNKEIIDYLNEYQNLVNLIKL